MNNTATPTTMTTVVGIPVVTVEASAKRHAAGIISELYSSYHVVRVELPNGAKLTVGVRRHPETNAVIEHLYWAENAEGEAAMVGAQRTIRDMQDELVRWILGASEQAVENEVTGIFVWLDRRDGGDTKRLLHEYAYGDKFTVTAFEDVPRPGMGVLVRLPDGAPFRLAHGVDSMYADVRRDVVLEALARQVVEIDEAEAKGDWDRGEDREALLAAIYHIGNKRG